MLESLFQLSSGCVLLAQIADLEPTEYGWLLENRVEVLAETTCTYVDINLQPGVYLDEYRGQAKRFDGPNYTLEPERFEFFPMDIHGRRQVRLHLPEFDRGDKLFLNLAFQHRGTNEFTWLPGTDGTQWADLRVHRSVTIGDPGNFDLRGNRLRLNDPEPTDTVSFSHPNQQFDDLLHNQTGLPSPETAVQTRRTLTLIVPDGDPQVALWPGGGSKVEVEEIVHLAPEEQERVWVVPLPSRHEGLIHHEEPQGIGVVLVREDDVLIIADSSEVPLDVALRYSFPDAPTFGEALARPNEVLDLHVRAPRGTVSWEADNHAWWLQAIGDEPVLPTREHLFRALQYRFNQVSYPEPAVPMRLRGARKGWDLVTVLYQTMQSQVVQATWPTKHLWPRPLIQARKSGAVTSVEAALMLRVYLLQSRIQADWVLVQPANEASIFDVVPTRYDEALVRVSYGGEERWLDPGCVWCAPFEIRPELQDAPALAHALNRTPSATPGLMSVEIEGDSAHWQLEGPPALLARMSGKVETESTEEFGTPLLYSTADEPGLEELHIDEWCQWIGVRRLIRPLPDNSAQTEADETHGPVHYRRTYGDGQVIEEWTIIDRRLDSIDLGALNVARVVPAKQDDAAPDDRGLPPDVPEDSESPR